MSHLLSRSISSIPASSLPFELVLAASSRLFSSSGSSAAARPSRPRTAKPEPVFPPPVHPILLETDRLLVLNKPAGAAVQGSYGTTARLAWDRLVDDLSARPESPNLFPVHRLDKATTGTMVLAKSPGYARGLSTQFKNHDVKRTYLAVVHGAIKVGYEGLAKSYVKVEEYRVRLAEENEDGAKLSETAWKCLASSSNYSLVELTPKTGRKHQLRIHMSKIVQAPIVGDFKYNPSFADIDLLNLPSSHILLHAHTMHIFQWAKSGKRFTVSCAAPLPAYFGEFCKDAGLELPEGVEVLEKEELLDGF
ncbi:ribosomal large subunit pseudouridine synthase D [Pseudohyphozyma bogoriensis]|nr:ribosomal large subunit pseudouridine synthase D [Pseudohyphozyma bogoriensis]